MQQYDFLTSSPRINEALKKLSRIVQQAPAEALNLIQEITLFEEFQNDIPAKAYVDKFRGIIYFSIKQYDKSYRYFKKALSNFEKSGNLNEQSNILNNISLYYYGKGEYYKAIEELEKSLEIHESLNNRQAQLAIYNNICEIYRTIDRHDKAIRVYEKVLNSGLNHSDRLMICLMQVNLADSFLMTGLLSEAHVWIEKTDEHIPKCADLNLLKLHYRNCYNYYRLKENYKSALEYYIKFNDYREQQARRMEDFQSQYFLKKQELEILQKQKDELEIKNTHLQEMHQTLNEKNIFLNTIISTIPIPFFVIDTNEVYLECNEAFASVFGKTREDFIGKSVGISSSISQTKSYLEMDKKLLKEKKLQVYETSITDHSGKILHVIFFKNVFYGKNGEVAGILGSFIDLSEKRELLKSLQKSEEQLAAVFHHAAVGIVVFSMKWKPLFINSYLQELLGYNKEEIEQINQKVLSNDKSKQYFDNILLSLEQSNARYIRRVHRFVTKQKKEVWGDLSISLLHDEFNNPDSFICVFSDVTEAKKYEDSLSKLNNLLSSVMNSPYQIYIASLDRNYRYTSFNKNYQDTMKKHRNLDITLGGYYLDNYPGFEDKENHRRILDNVLRGQVHTGFREYSLESKQEILEYFYCPIVSEDNSIEGITIYSVDVTDKILTQRALQQSEAELKSANYTKDQFFSIIAHDLRAPLGNIRSVLEFISSNEDTLNEEEKNDFIKELHMEASETFNLLENLLLWSRSQRDGIIINPSRVEVRKIVGKILKLYNKIAQRKNIEISTDIDSDLVGFFDYNTIETVLRNLLNNAVKFTPAGGKIMLSAHQRNDEIIIVISDTGIGISKDRLPSIFAMDENITNNHTREDSGSGLGLILSHDFVRRNNGTISVKSKVGEGTTFTLSLPLSD
ncbi:MAG: PAS domain S-box protein [Candidatus Cloacimonetes bacterium]|nr:PAS domain S-box protein [Candidatus Cloacimonadota bacterium]